MFHSLSCEIGMLTWECTCLLMQGKLCIITEYAGNGNLHDYIKKEKQCLPEDLIWKLYIQVSGTFAETGNYSRHSLVPACVSSIANIINLKDQRFGVNFGRVILRNAKGWVMCFNPSVSR